MSKTYVTLFVSDDSKQSDFQAVCTEQELIKLKDLDKKGDITLIGWLPGEFYNGGDISQFHTKFKHW